MEREQQRDHFEMLKLRMAEDHQVSKVSTSNIDKQAASE